jgi:GNAT superfamily N-acetyltransferase
MSRNRRSYMTNNVLEFLFEASDTPDGKKLPANESGRIDVSRNVWKVAHKRFLWDSRALAYCRRVAEALDLELEELEMENDSSVIWVEDRDGSPIGAIVFSYEEKGIWMEMAFVEPERRRQGVYSLMYKKLLRVAEHKRAKCIAAMVDKQNYVMLQVAASRDCEITKSTWPYDPCVVVRDYL